MPSEKQADWPIIIGGCHRSGTSVLRRIFDSHSHIHCGPEVKFFADLYGTAHPWSVLGFMWTARTLIDEDELIDVIGPGFIELHERAARAAGKARWADKAPENVLYWPQWQRLLEDRWLFVHVLRNPLDTIASIIEADFADVPVDLMARVQHYRASLEAGIRFGAEHPDRYRVILYEHLVSDPSATLEGLMHFLGETLEARQLAFNDQPHQVGLEDPNVAVTTEVHSNSVHRWPSVLPVHEAELIWDLTADLWESFDPELRFVEPPAATLSDSDSPRAGPPVRRSTTR